MALHPATVGPIHGMKIALLQSSDFSLKFPRKKTINYLDNIITY